MLSLINTLYKSKVFWLLEHTFFVCIPLVIFTSYIGSTFFRYLLLTISALYMVGISYLMGARLLTIGLTTKYFNEALSHIAFPTLISGVLIFITKFLFPSVLIKQSINSSPIFLYILISVPLQEILFRGFCLWRCKLTWKSTLFIVLFNSFLFAMYHMLFNNWYLTAGIFLINIFWSYAFIKYPNLFAFMFTHAFIGIIYFLNV